MGTEIGRFFLAAKAEAELHPARFHGRSIWQHMGTLLNASWTWPTHRGTQCRSAHSWLKESRRVASEKAGRFRGQASEIIAIYPMVRFYVEKYLGDVPDLAQRRGSLMKCFGVLDILMDYTNGKISRRGCLKRALSEWLEAFKTAYPDILVKPKAHYMQHVPSQVLRDFGMLLDCFVTERKHQMAKAAIRSTDKTVVFERGGLARVLTEHIRGLNKLQLYMSGIVGDSCEYDGGSMGLYLKWKGDSFGCWRHGIYRAAAKSS